MLFTFYVINVHILNRRSGVVVERPPRMQEIEVKSPVETDLSLQNM